jgi:hypothetical protein
MDDTDAAELEQLRLARLATLMGDISEDCWCAGWLGGNEFSLYHMAFNGMSRRYGMGEVREQDTAELRRLAEATGTWFRYGDNGIEAVPLAEFAALANKDHHHA